MSTIQFTDFRSRHSISSYQKSKKPRVMIVPVQDSPNTVFQFRSLQVITRYLSKASVLSAAKKLTYVNSDRQKWLAIITSDEYTFLVEAVVYW